MALEVVAERLTSCEFSTVRESGTKSYGPAAVEHLRHVGIELFPWQEDWLDELLEVNDEDRLTRATSILICPRRNGKTLAIAARALIGILFLGEKRVLYTAHLADTCQEIFGMMKMIVSHPLLEETVAHVYDSNGKERIEFTNGGRFQVRTRTGHGGRGRETDLLIFDEAMILDANSESSLLPLTAAASSAGRGQVIYASSAGSDSEESAILKRLSERGRDLAGTTGNGVSFREYTADRTLDIADPATWRRANPSLGTPVLSEQFLRDQLSRMNPEEFGREHLSWWSATTDLPLIDPAVWSNLIVEEEPEHVDPTCWVTFDLGLDRRTARILAFYRTTEERIAVSVIDSINVPDGIKDDAYAQRVLGIVDRYGPEVIGYERLTGESIARVLAAAGWEARLRPITGQRAANGVGTLLASVRNGTLVHDGHGDLAGDLSRAVGKPFADGGQVFSRKNAVDGSIAGAIALGAGMFLAADELVV